MGEQTFSQLGQAVGSRVGERLLSNETGQALASQINQSPLLTGQSQSAGAVTRAGGLTTLPATQPQGGGILGGPVTGQSIGQSVGGAAGNFIGGSIGSRLDKLRDAELGPQSPIPMPPLPPVAPGVGIPATIPDPRTLVIQPQPLTLAMLLGGR